MKTKQLLFLLLALFCSVLLCSCDRNDEKIDLSPQNATIEAGHYLQYTVLNSPSTNKGYSWQLYGGINDPTIVNQSITAGGLALAPTATGTYEVRCYASDGSKSVASTDLFVTKPLSIPVAVTILSPTASKDQVSNNMFQCSASVAGTVNQQVTWSVVTSKGGTIDINGLYTPPAANGTYMIKATSVADPTKSATASLMVGAETPSVEIDGLPSAPITTGSNVQLSAKVLNGTTQTVTWSTSAGTITQTGLLTAPTTPESITVTAKSTAYNVFSTASIVVDAASNIGVKITGPAAPIFTGSQYLFTAAVSGTTNQAVTWSVVTPNGGTITSAGIYTAPAINGEYTVQAVSQADGKTKATFTEQVDGSYFDLNLTGPTSAFPGNTEQFTASVNPPTNVTYKWSIVGPTGGMTISSTGLLTIPVSTTPGYYDVHVVVTTNNEFTDRYIYINSI